MPEIAVRLAEAKDIAAIQELRYQVLDRSRGVDRRGQISEKDTSTTSILVGAFLANRVISTVRLDPLENHTYLVRRMATDSDFQGQGIGSRVLEKAEEVAMERDAQRFILHARTGAIPFYEKHSYILTGAVEYHDGDRNDEMVKIIAR